MSLISKIRHVIGLRSGNEFPSVETTHGATRQDPHRLESKYESPNSRSTLVTATPLLVSSTRTLRVWRAGSLNEYLTLIERSARTLEQMRQVEATLVPKDWSRFTIEGHCVVCGETREFAVAKQYARGRFDDGRTVPNWREHLNCKRCGFRNRVRSALHLIEQELAPSAQTDLYVTEQLTPFYRYVATRLPRVVGSEYLGKDHPLGEVVDGIRNEDIQNLSFPDSSFDAIVSLDVLEHVPDHAAALAELHRCLRPGGRLLLAAPFRARRHDHDVRAVMRDDFSIEHLQEPEYHGNPAKPTEGALCFKYFGWQLVDDLKAAGFSSAEILFWWDRELAYLGNTNSIVLASA